MFRRFVRTIAATAAVLTIAAAPIASRADEASALPTDGATDQAAETRLDLPTPRPSASESRAPAQTQRTTADAAAQTGTVTGRVGFTPDSGGPAVFRSGATVRFSLRTGAADYVERATVPVAADGRFQSPALEAGAYDVEVDPLDDFYALEHYDDARYFSQGVDVQVVSGSSVDLGDIVIDRRYFDVGRIFGADRYSTAVEVSRALFRDAETVPVVYLASGTTFADALAAGPAAIHQGGIVLTTPGESLSPAVSAELGRISAERVVIVGGPAAVSQRVMAQVQELTGTAGVERIGGASRYETSSMIVRDAFPEGSDGAVLATGRTFADALAAGAAAGYLAAPLILVDGAAARLPAEAAQLLSDLGASRVRVAGGSAAVSAGIASDLAVRLGTAAVTRHFGADRYETAVRINRDVFRGNRELGFLATGTGFADALAGAPLAGALGAPLYLTPPTCIPASLEADLLSYETVAVWLLGGESALSPDVAELTRCG